MANFPVLRFASLAVRLFSRPVIEMMKTVHYQRVKPNSKFNDHLIKLGNFHFRQKVKIDKFLLNIGKDDELFLSGLNKRVALEKGINFFYESLFYVVVIGATTWEGFHAVTQMRLREAENKKEIDRLNKNLDDLIEESDEMIKTQEGIIKQFEADSLKAIECAENMIPYSQPILQREDRLHEFIELGNRKQKRLVKELNALRKRL